jgi:hypothetical protein
MDVGGFARDYAMLAELANHEYFSIHNDAIFPPSKWRKPNGWAVDISPGFHGSDIRVSRRGLRSGTLATRDSVRIGARLLGPEPVPDPNQHALPHALPHTLPHALPQCPASCPVLTQPHLVPPDDPSTPADDPNVVVRLSATFLIGLPRHRTPADPSQVDASFISSLVKKMAEARRGVREPALSV